MVDIRLTSTEMVGDQEDRFSRFRLIGWWDQERLARSRVLVIGAGALGNEIIKNLALLGVGNILVVDMDHIENSNLSRSILYREKDNGSPKAMVAALAARDIYPSINVHHFMGNVIYDLGMGVFRWADIVLGGLDNREARLTINRHCYKLNRPWIDGAIEEIQGISRVFVPDGPCYECTMSEMDWKLLQMRRSCNLLAREEMEAGKTPTTPTISSIIAGVQCQEAVKILHNIGTMAGHGWIFQGLTGDSYLVEYQKKEECYSHDMIEKIVLLEGGAGTVVVGDLLEQAKRTLGPETVLEINRDMLEKLICPRCGKEEVLFTSLGKTNQTMAFCSNCPSIRRQVVTFYSIHGNEAFLDKSFAEIGVPQFDIITARNRERSIGYELSADASDVLGPLDASVPVELESL